MTNHIETALVIPSMDKTSIHIDDDGDLTITQTSPQGEAFTILVPYAYLPVFSEVLITAIEGEVKKQKAETATGDLLNRFRARV